MRSEKSSLSPGGEGDKVKAKEKMKIALVLPPGGYYAERWQRGVMMPSLGICYLGAVLEKNGFTVRIIDAHVEKMGWRGLQQALQEYNPNVVGVSFTTENRFEGFKAIRLAKRVLPQAKTIAGGPHISLAAKDALVNCPELDVAVVGEGEYVLLELIKAIADRREWSDLPGVVLRAEDGEVKENPRASFIQNLDELPFPAFHLLSWEKYNFQLSVPGKGDIPAADMVTSRGCPFNCNFCASPIMWGRKVRTRSPENVIAEAKFLAEKYRIRAIWFFDDTFTVSRDRVERICDLMEEEKLDINWFCEIRVDTVDRQLLSRMRETGCFEVGFGVESGSQRILDEVIGKKIRVEEVRQVAHWCKELGIVATPFFIFSHPDETVADARLTIDLMREMSCYHKPTLSLLHVYPGTKLEKLAREKGILPKNFSWSRRFTRGVVTLPSAQGNVPIFVDKLSWGQVCDFMFQWAEKGNYALRKKIPGVIKSIRSWGDFKRYFILFIHFLKYRLQRKER